MAGKKKTEDKPVDDPETLTVEDAVVVSDEAAVDSDAPVEDALSEAEAEAEVAEDPAQPEPAAQTQTPAEPEKQKRGGFVPALLGGAIAAAIGFAAGNAGLLGSGSSDAVTALEAKLADQSNQIEALTKSLSGTADLDSKIGALTDQVAPLGADLAALKSSVQGLAGQVDPLTARLTELENNGLTQGASPEAAAAFDAELKKLQDSLAAQRAEVEKMVSDAQALEAQASERAQAASNAAILSKLHSQLDAGQPYTDLISELTSGGLTVPADLSAPADKGVATVSALQAEFAPAARTALADARDADKGTGLVAFLQRQTGARSVTPQDGDDPDAILSRAQAALSGGDVAGALSELKSLPEAARTAMADWEQAAQTRVLAVNAADALASGANSN